MLRTTSSRPLLAFGLALLVAFVSMAGIGYAAKKFDPSHKRIKINRSIAGVRLGQSLKRAKHAWHGAVKCSHAGGIRCNWGSERKGHLSFVARNVDGGEKVFQVAIISGVSATHQELFRKPLTTLKTSKGIGLGSKKRAVKKAYPGGHSGPDPGQYRVRRGTKTETVFQFTLGGRVASITMYRAYGDQQL